MRSYVLRAETSECEVRRSGRETMLMLVSRYTRIVSAGAPESGSDCRGAQAADDVATCPEIERERQVRAAARARQHIVERRCHDADHCAGAQHRDPGEIWSGVRHLDVDGQRGVADID